MIADLIMRGLGYRRIRGPSRAKEADLPYTWPVWAEGTPDPSPSTMATMAQEGYSANAIIYSCIARKAESAALAPPRAYVGERDAPEPLPDDHPLAQILRWPNRYMSWFELQEMCIVYLELDGNVFLYKAREDQNGPVVGLYPLRPDRVRPVPKGGQILGYVYDGQDTGMFQGLEPFLPDEIIHIKYPNPDDPFEGLGRGASPLASIVRTVDLDNANTTFLTQFFRNAAVPFGLLTTKVKLIDEEVERIRARIRAQYAGMRNWHEMMILDADAEYQRLGLNLQELDFSSLDARNEARICAVLRVPSIIAGAKIGIERSTYNNYGEARRSFWEDTLVPMYRRFEDALNAGMRDEFEDRPWIAYDFSAVPALAEPVIDRDKRTVEAWRAGVLRRNEARARLGLEPDAEVDGFIEEILGGIKSGGPEVPPSEPFPWHDYP